MHQHWPLALTRYEAQRNKPRGRAQVVGAMEAAHVGPIARPAPADASKPEKRRLDAPEAAAYVPPRVLHRRGTPCRSSA